MSGLRQEGLLWNETGLRKGFVVLNPCTADYILLERKLTASSIIGLLDCHHASMNSSRRKVLDINPYKIMHDIFVWIQVLLTWGIANQKEDELMKVAEPDNFLLVEKKRPAILTWELDWITAWRCRIVPPLPQTTTIEIQLFLTCSIFGIEPSGLAFLLLVVVWSTLNTVSLWDSLRVFWNFRSCLWEMPIGYIWVFEWKGQILSYLKFSGVWNCFQINGNAWRREFRELLFCDYLKGTYLFHLRLTNTAIGMFIWQVESRISSIYSWYGKENTFWHILYCSNSIAWFC